MTAPATDRADLIARERRRLKTVVRLGRELAATEVLLADLCDAVEAFGLEGDVAKSSKIWDDQVLPALAAARQEPPE